jgi:hypothetical protein
MNKEALHSLWEETQFKKIIRSTFEVEHKNCFVRIRMPFIDENLCFGKSYLNKAEEIFENLQLHEKHTLSKRAKFILLLTREEYVCVYNKKILYSVGQYSHARLLNIAVDDCGIFYPHNYILPKGDDSLYILEQKNYFELRENQFHIPSGEMRSDYMET